MNRAAVLAAATIGILSVGCALDKPAETTSADFQPEAQASVADEADPHPADPSPREEGSLSQVVLLAASDEHADAMDGDNLMTGDEPPESIADSSGEVHRDAKEATEEAARKIMDATVGAANKIREVGLGAVQSVRETVGLNGEERDGEAKGRLAEDASESDPDALSSLDVEEFAAVETVGD